jgi:hypothetical protein
MRYPFSCGESFSHRAASLRSRPALRCGYGRCVGVAVGGDRSEHCPPDISNPFGFLEEN